MTNTMVTEAQQLAAEIKRLAFSMPAPNPYTPQFVSLAIMLEQYAHASAALEQEQEAVGSVYVDEYGQYDASEFKTDLGLPQGVYDLYLAPPVATREDVGYRKALQKIADLVDSEADWPLDDAIDIANRALASPVALSTLLEGGR